MFETIEAKAKIKKWEWIPVIGTVIYATRFETFISLEYMGSKIPHIIKKYRTIWNLFFLVVGLAFLITFFVIRNKYGFGKYPWPFWVGLGVGLGQSTFPLPARILYLQGIKDLKKLQPEVIEEYLAKSKAKKEKLNSLKEQKRPKKD